MYTVINTVERRLMVQQVNAAIAKTKSSTFNMPVLPLSNAMRLQTGRSNLSLIVKLAARPCCLYICATTLCQIGIFGIDTARRKGDLP